MELNSCENGSLNMEINDDEEILVRNKSSLCLKPAETDCSISSEENTDDNVTGKNKKDMKQTIDWKDHGGLIRYPWCDPW